MGRQTVARCGGDSSPSSAESSFRELDDVFLQSQTRTWLEEVLGTRLDEDSHVSELLQDGELLFEVSQIVRNLLLSKCVELRYLKGKYGPFASRRKSGRYEPYSNVDSFLKTCKILGLGSVDLFSPSDVVEKRDTRKVCICLRALSKKARTKQLSVPDFDMVMYSVSMPTDMVGYIRKSLELSQPTLSSSSSYYSSKGSQMEPKKTVPCDRNDDSCSEDSDEAESGYTGESSFPEPRKAEYAGVSSALEDSGEVYLAFDHSVRRRNVVVPDVEGPCKDDFDHNFNGSFGSSESLKSCSPQKFEKIYRRCRNGAVGVSDAKLTLENDNFAIEDASCIDGKESNYIADYSAFSDLMIHETDDSNSVFLDGKKFSDDEEMEESSTTSMSSVLDRVLDLELDYENVYSSESLDHGPEEQCNDGTEAQSRTQSAESYTPSHNVCSSSEMEHSSDGRYDGSSITSQSKNSEMVEPRACVIPFDPLEAHLRTQSMELFTQPRNICLLSEMEFLKGEPSTLSYKVASRETVSTANSAPDSNPVQYGRRSHLISSDFVCNLQDSDTALACLYCHETGEQQAIVSDASYPCRVSEDKDNHNLVVQENYCQTVWENANVATDASPERYKMPVESTSNAASAANHYQGKEEHCVVDNGIETKSVRRLNTSGRFHPGKLVQKPLVKTLFKSTAIAGVFLVLLHINKNQESDAQESLQYVRAQAKFSMANRQTGTQNRQTGIRAVYPTEKIKLRR